jgi:hypothetical protein
MSARGSVLAESYSLTLFIDEFLFSALLENGYFSVILKSIATMHLGFLVD